MFSVRNDMDVNEHTNNFRNQTNAYFLTFY